MYTFDKIRDGIYAVQYPDEEDNELYKVLEKWNDTFFLRQLFRRKSKLKSYFGVDDVNVAVQDTLEDVEYLGDVLTDGTQEELEQMFHPLASEDATLVACSRRKARNWERDDHPSWLRLYAVKLESGVYVITGGAIKMARKMQSERATDRELQKLNEIRQYFLDKGVLKITESQ